MDFIMTLYKMIRRHPKWLIDVDYEIITDDNGNIIDSKTVFVVRRWSKDSLHYTKLGEFRTFEEALEFRKKYNAFPLDVDGAKP